MLSLAVGSTHCVTLGKKKKGPKIDVTCGWGGGGGGLLRNSTNEQHFLAAATFRDRGLV